MVRCDQPEGQDITEKDYRKLVHIITQVDISISYLAYGFGHGLALGFSPRQCGKLVGQFATK